MSKVRDCHGYNLIIVELDNKFIGSYQLVLDYLIKREKNSNNDQKIKKKKNSNVFSDLVMRVAYELISVS